MQTEFDMAELAPVLCEIIERGGQPRLYPRGTSMEPLLHAGRDSVELAGVRELRKNGIYLYQRENGQYVLHRLIGFGVDGTPVFRGDNQTAKEYGVRREAILAEVTEIFHGESACSLHSLRYRLYLLWLCFPPLRFLRFFSRRVRGYLARKIQKRNKKKQ